MTDRPGSDRRATFEERGFLGPLSLLSREECAAVLALLGSTPPPPVWSKGNAAASRAWYAIGCLPEIVAILEEILGPDILLWGAKLIRQGPGRVHPWHTDIETSADAPGCASVWIGLENVDRRSTFEVISRSHRLGSTLQGSARAAGTPREATTGAAVEAWAREQDPSSERIRLDVGVGDAIVFDGRLWHGTSNSGQSVRSALLLQYAIPARAVRIPDLDCLEPPFRTLDEWPPCVVVRGRGDESVNRIVPPPPPTTSWSRALRLPLADGDPGGWTRHPIAAGPTPCLEHLGCHASVLEPGKIPHEPHRHIEEEILIVLDGEAQLVIVDDEGQRRAETARAGAFAYYPAWQRHTIHNATERPITYCMFKWRNGKPGARSPAGTLRTAVFEPGAGGPGSARDEDGRRTIRRVVEGPTDHLQLLHCHRSEVAPGGGYAPHVDPYDVAIVVLEGSVETLDARCEPHDVVFYAAGEPHGLRNAGQSVARYLVLEFHATARASLTSRLRRLVPVSLQERIPPPVIRLARKVLDRIPV